MYSRSYSRSLPRILQSNPLIGTHKPPGGKSLFLDAQKYNLLTLDVVKAALSGKTFQLTGTPDNALKANRRMFAQYIQDGIYLNNLGSGGTTVVPSLSPLFLMIFARMNADVKEQKVAKAIVKMLELEPNCGWKQYEHFHAHWEMLYRILFHGKMTSIMEHYHISQNNVPGQCFSNFKNRSWVIQAATLPLVSTSYKQQSQWRSQDFVK